MPRPPVSDAPWRRVTAVGLLTLVTVTGCDPADGPPATTPSPAPTGGVTPTGLVEATGPFPQTAREYADATVAAWTAPDLYRLSELTGPRLYQEIVDQPDPPDPSWTPLGCDPADAAGPADDDGADPAGSPADGRSDAPSPGGATPPEVTCSFYNADGDLLTLTLDRERLGRPAAAVALDLRPTRYPGRPLPYVTEFVTAWRDGNQGRMRRLAVTRVVTEFSRLTPATEPEIARDPAGSADRPRVVVTTGDAGQPAQVVIELNSALLGEPLAIRRAEVDRSDR